MKALIANGVIAELHETGFPVAEPFFWADAPSGVKRGWLYENGEFSAPDAPPSPPVVAVSRLQGILALDEAGLYDEVLGVVNDPNTPRAVRLAWENAQTFERSSQALAYLAQKVGITSQQLDDLFAAASEIQA